ncbi:MAG TPA: orotidine-5'-phosphate decarboxylase [Acidimicrobiales bacterium]|jgi:orotidine-5'-phosphate decarboxylase|nr:orotidine-5'-phosphate decarboxylase [Acidimicrobiales bacterium]
MADTFYERLTAMVASHGPMCVGLDPSAALLERWGLADDAAGAESLARATVESVAGIAGIVKCQVAFFERHGAAGYAALERVLVDARAAGMLVIGDAKRGDIASTNEGYADAWLRDESPLCVDAMTVSCYLGAAALAPVFALAHAGGRGVFAVVASSNDEGRALQTARDAAGRTVEDGLLDELTAISSDLDGEGPTSRCLGAVIGAQRRPLGLARFGGPVLVTGMGAQGSDAKDVASLRATLTHDAVAVNVSRSVLGAGPARDGVAAAAARIADELR